MKNLRAIAVVVLCGLMSVGYAASPKPSGYLSDYDRLVEGEYLEAYWVDMPRVEKNAPPRFLLGEIAVSGIKDHKGVTVSDCVGWLRDDLLAKPVRNSGIHDIGNRGRSRGRRRRTERTTIREKQRHNISARDRSVAC